MVRKAQADMPGWIKEFRRRTALIEVISKAYENSCECEVCTMLRQIGNDLGNMFMPQTPEVPRRR